MEKVFATWENVFATWKKVFTTWEKVFATLKKCSQHEKRCSQHSQHASQYHDPTAHMFPNSNHVAEKVSDPSARIGRSSASSSIIIFTSISHSVPVDTHFPVTLQTSEDSSKTRK
jgi:hypothetical protein